MTVVLLRREEYGANTFHIADNYPGMQIVTPDTIPDDATTIIRWGTTTNLPKRKKGEGKRLVINRADAIHQVYNKGAFRALASDHGLAPPTFLNVIDFLDQEEMVKNGVIVRPQHHAKSKDLHFCKTWKEVKDAVKAVQVEHGNYYISEFIPKDRELRIFIVQGRPVMVWDKHPKDKNDISWGCVEAGRLLYVKWSEWPMEAVRVATQAFNLSNLDFGAVDVVMEGDKAYFLEVNTAPEIWGYYGEVMATAFKYMIEGNSKDRIPVEDWTSWKNVIHPCLLEK